VTEPNIVVICFSAFALVMGVLAFLSLAIHALNVQFPQRITRIDQVLVAALSTTVSTLFGGARITKIEEIE